MGKAYTVIWEDEGEQPETLRFLGATCGHLTPSPHPDSVYRPSTAWLMFLNLLMMFETPAVSGPRQKNVIMRSASSGR